MRFIAFIGKAKAPMQIDVGFGDVVTPAPERITYPSLLDFPAPKLAGYPRETVIAEKYQAMVYLRTANTRMKDFHDIWLLAMQFPFEGRVLAKAITATFANRETAIDVNPSALMRELPEQTTMAAQWRAFRTRLGSDGVPATFPEIVGVLAKLLVPVARACAGASDFNMRWPPAGPWAPS